MMKEFRMQNSEFRKGAGKRALLYALVAAALFALGCRAGSVRVGLWKWSPRHGFELVP